MVFTLLNKYWYFTILMSKICVATSFFATFCIAFFLGGGGRGVKVSVRLRCLLLLLDKIRSRRWKVSFLCKSQIVKIREKGKIRQKYYICFSFEKSI